SPNSRQRASIFRAIRRARRMSVICCSWNSLGADWVITASSRTNFASTPLKSKRLDSSRLAWSTALISSWVSTSETISKDGMAGSGRVDGCAVDRPRAAPAQGTPWLPTQRMRAALRDLNVSRRRSGRVVPPTRETIPHHRHCRQRRHLRTLAAPLLLHPPGPARARPRSRRPRRRSAPSAARPGRRAAVRDPDPGDRGADRRLRADVGRSRGGEAVAGHHLDQAGRGRGHAALARRGGGPASDDRAAQGADHEGPGAGGVRGAARPLAAVAAFAARLGGLEAIMPFRSASFELDVAIAARILSLNPAIYEEIQFGNTHAAEVLDRLLERLAELRDLVRRGDDEARARFRERFLRS